jgi:SOS response regulatory protein OraA/RecX
MNDESYKLLLKKAGALLARRAYSRGELRDRLVRRAEGFPVEPVLDRLLQLNLLNDTDYAYNFALRRIQQDGWSCDKVQQSLVRRQVANAIIEQVLEKISGEIGDESSLDNYLQEYRKRHGIPVDLKSLRRMFLHLLRRGFDEERILSVLKRMVPAALWHRFETGD